MLIRANEWELDRMDATGETNEEKRIALTLAMKTAEEEHRKLADYLEREIDYQVVPIRKLVYIQLKCGLLMADYLKSHSQTD